MDMDEEPPRSRSGYLALLWALVPFAVIGGLAFWYLFSPVNTFHLTCTYTVNAHVTADIVVDGQEQSASVVFQNSRSRRWISNMNSAGCIQPHGNAIAFKLSGDRVLLIPARICDRAVDVLYDRGSIDLMIACTGNQRYQNWAVTVDSAARPSKWQFTPNNTRFTIKRMVATPTWDNPSDNIDAVAPNLLRSDFERYSVAWRQSPETMLHYRRRAMYKARGEPYKFNVRHGAF